MVNRKSRRRQEKRLPSMDEPPDPDLEAMPPREDRTEPFQVTFPVLSSQDGVRAQVVLGSWLHLGQRHRRQPAIHR